MINHYIICAGFAWLSAQLIKFILELIIHRHIDFTRLSGSGGMPSAHTAFMCALSTLMLFLQGFNSAEFAICCCVSCIVIYDATGVRRETGKQAVILNKMMDEWLRHGSSVNFGQNLKELVGHSRTEVIGGFIYGIFVGVMYYLLIIK